MAGLRKRIVRAEWRGTLVYRDKEKQTAYLREWRKRNKVRANKMRALSRARKPALYAATDAAWFAAKGPEYHAYRNAKQRCNNPKSPKWADYGGRGIKFLFTSFEQFMSELGPRPKGKVLDRENNDGNYEAGNVRWIGHKTSLTNRRPSSTKGKPWSAARRAAQVE